MFTANEYVRKTRIAMGLSQQDFADLLGLPTAQYISNIERKKCPVGPVFVGRVRKAKNLKFMLNDLRDSAFSDAVEQLKLRFGR